MDDELEVVDETSFVGVFVFGKLVTNPTTIIDGVASERI